MKLSELIRDLEEYAEHMEDDPEVEILTANDGFIYSIERVEARVGGWGFGGKDNDMLRLVLKDRT